MVFSETMSERHARRGASRMARRARMIARFVITSFRASSFFCCAAATSVTFERPSTIARKSSEMCGSRGTRKVTFESKTASVLTSPYMLTSCCHSVTSAAIS